MRAFVLLCVFKSVCQACIGWQLLVFVCVCVCDACVPSDLDLRLI
jgi:hypothetical protein